MNIGGIAIGDITNAKIRAILTVNGNSTTPQQLLENQSITLYYYNEDDLSKDTETGEKYVDDSTTTTILNKSTGAITNKYIQFNGTLDNYGDIILRTPRYDEVDTRLKFNDEYSVLYSVIYYDKLDIDGLRDDSVTQEASGNKKLYYLISKMHIFKSATRNEYLIPFNGEKIIIVGQTALKLKDILTGGKLTLNMPVNINNIDINIFDNDTGQTSLIKCIFSGDNSTNTITLDFNNILTSKKDVNVIISVPTLLNINPLLEEKLDKGALTGIIETIETTYKDFDYLAELNSSKLIDSYDVINSFFDYNNIYNSLTLPKIDFENSEFKIVASSRK